MDDPVCRPRLLKSLVVTAAASTVPAGLVSGTARAATPGGNSAPRGCLAKPAAGYLGPGRTGPSTIVHARALLGKATTAFSCCSADLGRDLPAKIVGTQQLVTVADDPLASGLLAHTYILAARLLIKLDEIDLGLLAADRAHPFATCAEDAVLVGEAARNKAALVRKAGWHDYDAAIAQAAAHLTVPIPGLGPSGSAADEAFSERSISDLRRGLRSRRRKGRRASALIGQEIANEQ
ncbi:hypothetical protein [Actinomadura gamaensis]|uniref:Uncharacterized protein n=1 Tax=Actinomadura gamaensis TaxID=1763541 RepID=A0ABV9TRB6_9ACTN